MTPSQIAGTLGLDEMSVISAVPFEERPLPPPRDNDGDDSDRPAPRIRRIVRGV